MQPSLLSYEMKNIEKNMESANRRAVHPRHFEAQAPFADSGLGSAQQFPFGGAASDARTSGQFTSLNRAQPELSNYPGTLLSTGSLLSRPASTGGFGGSLFPSSMRHTGLPISRVPNSAQPQPAQAFPTVGSYSRKY